MPGKQKQTTTTNGTNQLTAYSPVKPVIDQGAGIMGSYLNNPNSTAVYSGPRVADMSRDTRAGMDLMRNSQGANDAYGFFSGIMNGGAGGMNPQVQQMQDAIQRRIQGATNATFSRAGITGGTANQESLARGLADGLANPLFAAYESDMARKMSAGQMLPGLDQARIGNMMGAGQVQDSYNQNKINADRQAFEENRTAPLKAWSEIYPMAAGLGSQFGTQTQQGTSTQTSKTPMGQMIGGGVMAGLGLMTGNPMAALGGIGGALGGGAAQQPSAPWSWNAPSGSSWFGSPYMGTANSNETLPWRR